MEREKQLPGVITMGGYEFQHRLARCWQELDAGGVVHIVAMAASATAATCASQGSARSWR